MKALLAALALAALAGCATVDPYAAAPIRDHLARGNEVGDCARLFRDTDAAIDRMGARDAQAPRVPGFPYLRVDRFTASLGEPAAALRDGFAPWSELMAWLDRAARAAEVGNAGAAGLPDAAALDACRYLLAVADSAHLGELRAAAQVPDDYSTTLRVLGLYPLTRLAFAAGIRRWHARTREVFEAQLAAGPLVRYEPGGVDAPPRVPRSFAFRLPQRSAAQWSELLRRHAPRLIVETASDDDRIGAPVWRGDAARIQVDTRQPVAYARVAFAHFAGKVVPQLVYTFWFPARPAEHSLDILAGPLDGLVWRVTLDADFTPLAYDSIHPCGCYHLFFPTERVRARPQPDSLDEGLFAPQRVAAPRADERIALRVASRTHYLQRIALEPARSDAAATGYAIRDDDELRRLPLPGTGGRTRSAFGPDGLIAGSERLERFFFWPMGIASAGQMRQWGRHATAFVGRRHFDDPWLIERYFESPHEAEEEFRVSAGLPSAAAGSVDSPRPGAAVGDLELGQR